MIGCRRIKRGDWPRDSLAGRTLSRSIVLLVISIYTVTRGYCPALITPFQLGPAFCETARPVYKDWSSLHILLDIVGYIIFCVRAVAFWISSVFYLIPSYFSLLELRYLISQNIFIPSVWANLLYRESSTFFENNGGLSPYHYRLIQCLK